MSVTQTSFRAAVFDADLDVPEGLRAAKDQPVGQRFFVYRNNVILSLIDALKTAFPLVHKLLGDKVFTDLAAIYVRKHPPRSPLMMFYGAELPQFLQTFEPLSHLGYLSDCARLDVAMRRSYHAADVAPIYRSVFQQNPEQLVQMRLSLSPATLILRSAWPLHDIWRVNFEEGAPPPIARQQDVLVTRREFDPEPHLLVPGVADWLISLEAGDTFGEAHEKAITAAPSFDLAAALTLALQNHMLIEFNAKDH